LFFTLPEAEARIRNDMIRRQTRPDSAMQRRLKLRRNLTHNVAHGRELGPGLGCAAHVVEDQPRILRDDNFDQFGIPGKAGHIVDDVSAMFQCAFGHSRFAGIDGDRYVELALQTLQDGNEAMQFLLFAKTFRAGPGALSSDVDDVRPLLLQFQSAGGSGVRIGILPSVTERIGRDIQDSDDESTGSEFEGAPAEIPGFSFANHSYRRQTIGSRLAALLAG